MNPSAAGGRHQQTLTAVDSLAPGYAQHCPAGLPDDALTAIAGRRALLQQHQPVDAETDTAVCDATGTAWPCLEYIRAAAGQLDESSPA